MRKNKIKIVPLLVMICGLVLTGIGFFKIMPMYETIGMIWTIVCLSITIVNGIKCFGSKGLPGKSGER